MFVVLAHGLVVGGIAVLLFGIVMLGRLLDLLPTGPLKRRWQIMRALVALFIGGYAGYLILFGSEHRGLPDLVVPTIFFFGAGFVWLSATLALRTASDLLRVGELEQASITDPLTGVFNRRYLDQRLAEETASTARYGFPLSLLMLDVDHFKHVNDRYGHGAGDEVLKAVAERLLAEVRHSDVCARFGGEEFSVVAVKTDAAAAACVAERIRDAIERNPCSVEASSEGPCDIRVTISIGVAQHASGEDVAALLAAADAQLYAAKAAGRNQVCCATAERPPESATPGVGSKAATV